MERPRDYLIDDGQRIPNWWFKITFLERAETVIRLGTKSKFGIMGFTSVTPFWASGVFHL